jgi:hypothetical protein
VIDKLTKTVACLQTLPQFIIDVVELNDSSICKTKIFLAFEILKISKKEVTFDLI